MNVLVTVASRQGATKEIAERIGEVLSAAGLGATVEPVEAVGDVARYDAVVVGSVVRIGHWIEPARRFVRDHGAALATRPVWLFSSGPIGDPPKPAGDPLEIGELMATLHARDHRVFAGKLEKEGLGLAERAIVAAVRAEEGDFRPWAEIDAWAAGIAAELRAGVVVQA
ncbi:MAG TPA: flavodoxin domain-containing protein [Candidatus Limnocylindrales bacterium]|nr:flavodoxin domain-containing protein [Candidatus Limnocylindrales bacterium]